MKHYCKILNNRLTDWVEKSGLINDEQNGFRSLRGCLDHCFSLISIIKNRLSSGLSTFCCFVDFQKAFDSVNHDGLWFKLLSMNVGGLMFKSIQSLYTGAVSAIRLNGMLTEWFPIENGVKQGCLLSPLLFSLYINDLISLLNDSKRGIHIDNTERICCLFYADDIVLIAETADDLQELLNISHSWCQKWRMFINKKKTNVVHFRPKGSSHIETDFFFGPLTLEFKPEYIYLGILLSEHLDLEKSVKRLCSAAHRALALLCNKSRLAGGFPLDVFDHLYYCMVVPVMDYGAEILGDVGIEHVNMVHHRACRAFLWVPRKTANAAIEGEMGWTPPIVRRKTSMIRYWERLIKLPADRITHRIFKWNLSTMSHKNQNWCFHVQKVISITQLPIQISSNSIEPVSSKQKLLGLAHQKLLDLEISAWKNELERPHGVRSKSQGNKLRTYKLLKQEFNTEKYLSLLSHRGHRSVYAMLRCGTHGLTIETGRYTGIAEKDRICPCCNLGEIENEFHFVMNCPKFAQERDLLLQSFPFTRLF
eukprot:Lithocolla_globosa_v1_NODE_1612_length_2444_cov_4.514417.p1 type:complete len:535 gc:universal NODE_1612_length_2444_cov_4.514417:2019-415(-)